MHHAAMSTSDSLRPSSSPPQCGRNVYLGLLKELFAVSNLKPLFASQCGHIIPPIFRALSRLFRQTEGPGSDAPALAARRQAIARVALLVPTPRHVLPRALCLQIKPLAYALAYDLHQSMELVELGLAVLERWTDTVSLDALKPRIHEKVCFDFTSPVVLSLIGALHTLFRPLPFPFGAAAGSLVGKLGGAARAQKPLDMHLCNTRARLPMKFLCTVRCGRDGDVFPRAGIDVDASEMLASALAFFEDVFRWSDGGDESALQSVSPSHVAFCSHSNPRDAGTIQASICDAKRQCLRFFMSCAALCVDRSNGNGFDNDFEARVLPLSSDIHDCFQNLPSGEKRYQESECDKAQQDTAVCSAVLRGLFLSSCDADTTSLGADYYFATLKHVITSSLSVVYVRRVGPLDPHSPDHLYTSDKSKTFCVESALLEFSEVVPVHIVSILMTSDAQAMECALRTLAFALDVLSTMPAATEVDRYIITMTFVRIISNQLFSRVNSLVWYERLGAARALAYLVRRMPRGWLVRWESTIIPRILLAAQSHENEMGKDVLPALADVVDATLARCHSHDANDPLDDAFMLKLDNDIAEVRFEGNSRARLEYVVHALIDGIVSSESFAGSTFAIDRFGALAATFKSQNAGEFLIEHHFCGDVHRALFLSQKTSFMATKPQAAVGFMRGVAYFMGFSALGRALARIESEKYGSVNASRIYFELAAFGLLATRDSKRDFLLMPYESFVAAPAVQIEREAADSPISDIDHTVSTSNGAHLWRGDGKCYPFRQKCVSSLLVRESIAALHALCASGGREFHSSIVPPSTQPQTPSSDVSLARMQALMYVVVNLSSPDADVFESSKNFLAMLFAWHAASPLPNFDETLKNMIQVYKFALWEAKFSPGILRAVAFLLKQPRQPFQSASRMRASTLLLLL